MLSATLTVLLVVAADAVIYSGRSVEVVDPGTYPGGLFPKAEAKVCVTGQQAKNCYTAPKGFGRVPKLSLIDLSKGEQAMFLEVESGGVSGWSLHFAVLKFCDQKQVPGCPFNKLWNYLPDGVSVSNQSRHAWWEVSEFSDAKIFLTAESVWGPGETKNSAHRCNVSIYALRSIEENESRYYLVDRFMTARSYLLNHRGEPADVLGEEKQEIVSRLKRVKAAWTDESTVGKPMKE